ncbi:Ataxin-3 [Tyrophagus putrescentiae]|nr:Ataxin-3 [Tyrophagus putrescentiae]
MNFAANPQDLIYHEKQEGRLCAVHCLNNLLQGSYFTAVDLGNLADQLDEAELQQMAEGGFDGEDYRRFVASPSSNKDDTGYFSLQVIQKALSNLTMEMIPFNNKSSNLAISLRANPTAAQAFICHYQDHWYALRKFGTQWINLNSVLSKPKPISDTYLSLFLEQLQTEGHSIYIIAGNLIQTEADQYLLEKSADPTGTPKRSHRRAHEDFRRETLAAVAVATLLSLSSLHRPTMRRWWKVHSLRAYTSLLKMKSAK